MKTYRILVLEDDLQALSALMAELSQLEDRMIASGFGDIAVTVYSTHEDVAEFVNSSRKRFDVILLDRDCKLAGSFHVIEQKKLDETEVIAISSVPEYNEQARARGIKRVILKEFNDLPKFSKTVAAEVEEILAQ